MMQKTRMKSLIIIGCLIALACSAMAYTKTKDKNTRNTPPSGPMTSQQGMVTFSANLTNDKIVHHGDGKVNLSLVVEAAKMGQKSVSTKNIDLVVVLDRSGSMDGYKIDAAKEAILGLVSSLHDGDRFGLITYSDTAHAITGVLAINEKSKSFVQETVQGIRVSGGTNLGAGLALGMDQLKNIQANGNSAKVILISDGLANQGITSQQALAKMAAKAVPYEMTVSTVGVGDDFNEQLMTMLADSGTGTYHYLSDPSAFAGVFMEEAKRSRLSVANAIEIRIPLPAGAKLIHAAGYPVETEGTTAIFRPGELYSGQTRKLYITLQFPTAEEKEYALTGISMGFKNNDQQQQIEVPEDFTIACVADQKKVFASYDKAEWEKKVVNEDFNRLREEVAADISQGNEEEAFQKIEKYEKKQQVMNQELHSSVVTDNLKKDVNVLRSKVGAAAAAPATAKKKMAKEMQFKGYSGRRSFNE